MQIRWLLGVLVIGMSLQAAEPEVPKKKPIARSPKVVAVAPRVTTQAVTLPSLTISELLAQNLTLAAGESQQLFAKTDFTGVDRVNVGFYANPDQDLSGTNHLVWWAIPGANNYVVVDYLQGKDFAFLNSGGATLATFGNQLMIEVRNNGGQPVTISQITIFGVAR